MLCNIFRRSFQYRQKPFLSNWLNDANMGEIHSFSINEFDFVPIEFMLKAAMQIDSKMQQRSFVE